MLPSYVRPSHNHASGRDSNRGGASCLAAPCCWWRGPQRSQGRAVFPDYISCLMGQALVPPACRRQTGTKGCCIRQKQQAIPRVRREKGVGACCRSDVLPRRRPASAAAACAAVGPPRVGTRPSAPGGVPPQGALREGSGELTSGVEGLPLTPSGGLASQGAC